jgi:hypothetical protein
VVSEILRELNARGEERLRTRMRKPKPPAEPLRT